MGQIDWAKESGIRVENKIRAFPPGPEAFIFWKRKWFKILTATILPINCAAAKPGEYFKDKGMQTVQGILQPATVQPMGKKAMAWEDFLREASHFP